MSNDSVGPAVSRRIEITGRYTPPRSGRVVLNVICKGTQHRIAYVRQMRRVGLVLWHYSNLDDDAPSRPTELSELKAGDIRNLTFGTPDGNPALRCPDCGWKSVDVVALIQEAEQSAGSKGAPAGAPGLSDLLPS